jgi:hypothetical protein
MQSRKISGGTPVVTKRPGSFAGHFFRPGQAGRVEAKFMLLIQNLQIYSTKNCNLPRFASPV